MLEDSVSPEFRAVLMDKTLRSARQRKRVRRFNLALGAAALMGIFAYSFREMRQPATSLNQIRPSILNTASAPALNLVRIVGTKLDSTLAVVQTSESDRPKEINDKELLTLLANKSVALVRYTPNRTELISFGSDN